MRQSGGRDARTGGGRPPGGLRLDPLDYIELIQSTEAITKRFSELQQSVTREILIFSKMPLAVPLEANVVGLELARTRQMRSVYNDINQNPSDQDHEGSRLMHQGRRKTALPGVKT